MLAATMPRVSRAAGLTFAQSVHDRAGLVEAIASAGGEVEVLDTMHGAPGDAELQAQCLGAPASPALAKTSIVRVGRRGRFACAALQLRHGQARLQALRRPPNLAFKSDRDAEEAAPRTPLVVVRGGENGPEKGNRVRSIC